MTSEDIKNIGGDSFLRAHNSSIVRALLSIYPNHDWSLWKFKSKVPLELWKVHSHQKRYLDYIGEKLGIVNQSEWKSVSANRLSNMNGRPLMKIFKTVDNAVDAVYGRQNLPAPNLAYRSGPEALIARILQRYFKISSSITKEKFTHSSGRQMQYDVVLADFKIIVEYQGEQHYITVSGLFISVALNLLS